MADGDCQHHRCRCAQHGPFVGAVTFSAEDSGNLYDQLAADGLRAGVGPTTGGSFQVSRELLARMLGAVDEEMKAEEDDAATVVELLQRGDSWHVSIRRGAMHYENAEPSLPAALEAVGRVLGQSVGSCAEVPTDRNAEKPEAKRCEAVGESSGLRCQEAVGHPGPHSAHSDDPSVFEAWYTAHEADEMMRRVRRGYAP